MEALRYNTAIARMTELTNHIVKLPWTPRHVAETTVLLVAPLAPHLAEELRSRLGHSQSLAYAPFPVVDSVTRPATRGVKVDRRQGSEVDRR